MASQAPASLIHAYAASGAVKQAKDNERLGGRYSKSAAKFVATIGLAASLSHVVPLQEVAKHEQPEHAKAVVEHVVESPGGHGPKGHTTTIGGTEYRFDLQPQAPDGDDPTNTPGNEPGERNAERGEALDDRKEDLPGFEPPMTPGNSGNPGHDAAGASHDTHAEDGHGGHAPTEHVPEEEAVKRPMRSAAEFYKEVYSSEKTSWEETDWHIDYGKLMENHRGEVTHHRTHETHDLGPRAREMEFGRVGRVQIDWDSGDIHVSAGPAYETRENGGRNFSDGYNGGEETVNREREDPTRVLVRRGIAASLVMDAARNPKLDTTYVPAAYDDEYGKNAGKVRDEVTHVDIAVDLVDHAIAHMSDARDRRDGGMAATEPEARAVWADPELRSQAISLADHALREAARGGGRDGPAPRGNEGPTVLDHIQQTRDAQGRTAFEGREAAARTAIETRNAANDQEPAKASMRAAGPADDRPRSTNGQRPSVEIGSQPEPPAAAPARTSTGGPTQQQNRPTYAR